ncbi:hypothetical protein OG496_00965 [Streptomyces sp. NBC_00988]|uniref:hypothetical protein n=1 Tax=Streptomyces sp. NBC_00988 TaxID=2903704 RepID=UPI003865CA00|nr:hypothetical protein OG496_00965 [Streptomyces sp. NBC_00988]
MLSIPEAVWGELLDAFALAPPGHERVAYLDGFRFRDADGVLHGVATTVTVPDAATSPGRYTVTSAAMNRAGSHFERLGLVRLAQIHTHGGRHVRHSWVDDQQAYSQMDGALSLVLPHHAAGRPTPVHAGVHLRGPEGWTRVHGAGIHQVLRLVPSLIDHRSTPWTTSPTGTREISKAGSRRSRIFSRWPWRSSSIRARPTGPATSTPPGC